MTANRDFAGDAPPSSSYGLQHSRAGTVDPVHVFRHSDASARGPPQHVEGEKGATPTVIVLNLCILKKEGKGGERGG